MSALRNTEEDFSGACPATPAVSIIIVNYQTPDLLAQCLVSIAATAAGVSVETIVVDNACRNGSLETVRAGFPAARLIVNATNVGFARAVNQGSAESNGAYVLLLNSDAQLRPNALQLMVALAAARPRAAVIGARICNPDGSFQASHMPFPSLGQEFLMLSGIGRLLHGPWYPSSGPDDGPTPHAVDWVAGACLLLRRDAFAAAGGFDAGYFLYGEEMDLCYTLRQRGWEVWHHPQAHVTHVGGASSRRGDTERETQLYRGRVRFFRKHYGRTPARLLRSQIYAFTAIKRVAHGLLRWVTRGRHGRHVVPLRALSAALHQE